MANVAAQFRSQAWDRQLVDQAAQGQGQGWNTLER